MGKLREYIPALKYGHKIYPEDIAGLVGVPFVGDVFYVDPTNGSDTANNGRSQDNAFKSLYKAHSSVQSNHHDVIIVTPGGVGSGTGTEESTAVSGGAWTFSKNLTYVVGNAAPSRISPRSRILWGTAGQSTSGALLTISGQGNIFKNLQVGTFVDNNIVIKLTGSRNVFEQVHIAGIGDATAGDDTAARSLWISGGSENLFEDCVIGLDTIARSVANAEIEMSGAATRNQFRGCDILSFADNAGHLFVKAATAADVDRFAIFDHCRFMNSIKSTATTMTVAMDLTASLGGAVILHDSWLFGATDWADDFTNVYTAGAMVAATANTAGLMAVAA